MVHCYNIYCNIFGQRILFFDQLFYISRNILKSFFSKYQYWIHPICIFKRRISTLSSRITVIQSVQLPCSVSERIISDYFDESDDWSSIVKQTMSDMQYVGLRLISTYVCAAVIPLIPQIPWHLDNACSQFRRCTSDNAFILDRNSVRRHGML